MAKRKCPNGHIYDSSIYGDHCPFCPQEGGETELNNDLGGGHTVIDDKTQKNDSYDGHTVKVDLNTAEDDGPIGGTVIHKVGDNSPQQGRKLVGFLVTYNQNPMGKAYNIYEGRNSIGSAPTNDIVIDRDSEVSKRHLTILFRTADMKFRFKDELSTNGTYINDQFVDEGVLKDHDVIRVGNTFLIFMAVPFSLNSIK